MANTIASDIKREVWEFLRDMGRDMARDTLKTRLKPAVERRNELQGLLVEMKDHDGGELAVERITRRLQAMLLCGPRPDGKSNYMPGDENKAIVLLSDLYEAHNQTPEERALRIRVFISLGNLPDDQFDLHLKMMEDDGYIQMIKRAWVNIDKGIDWIKANLIPSGETLRSADARVATVVAKFHDSLIDYGILSPRKLTGRTESVVPVGDGDVYINANSGSQINVNNYTGDVAREGRPPLKEGRREVFIGDRTWWQKSWVMTLGAVVVIIVGGITLGSIVFWLVN